MSRGAKALAPVCCGWLLVLITATVATVAAASEPANEYAYPVAKEYAPQIFAVAGPMNQRDAEISAMAWCDGKLLVVPQYPDFYDRQTPVLFSLSPEQISAAIELDEVIEPELIAIENYTKLARVSSYEGIEALVCNDNDLYLAAEINSFGRRDSTVIARARWRDNTVEITHVGKPIPSLAPISNHTNETLVLVEDGLLSIHELNSRHNQGQAPRANWLDLNGQAQSLVPMAQVLYRITDATALDGHGRFWVTNYLYRKEKHLNPGPDGLWARFGRSDSQAMGLDIERVVELQWRDGEVTLSGRAPINIALDTRLGGRNWEAVARWQDRGLLLATDEYPATLLAFLPFVDE